MLGLWLNANGCSGFAGSHFYFFSVLIIGFSAGLKANSFLFGKLFSFSFIEVKVRSGGLDSFGEFEENRQRRCLVASAEWKRLSGWV
jgi:hypothetical protein